MNSSALLQSQPFHLDYPPSSSETDCIGHQRPFPPSATFPTEEDHHTRRIGSLGQSLSQSGATPSTHGLPYSPSPHDVPFASASGLLMSPLSAGNEATSSTPSYQPGYLSDVTSAEGIVSNPASLYSQPSLSWTERMSGFPSNPRIPALLPSANIPRPLQGHGPSMSNSPGLIGRDSYPNAYTLSRNYPSPSASVNDISRYSYSSSIPSGLGTQLEPPNSLYPSSFKQSHRAHPESPQFLDTKILHTVTTNHHQVQPSIIAKIHKGFFQVDDKWTCYRRNYFSVTCSFTLQPQDHNATYFVQLAPGQHSERIRNFAMSISAVVNSSESETRELVQHTPKRDKQSEKKPDKVVLQPQYQHILSSNTGPSSALYGLSHPGSIPFDYNVQYPMQTSNPPTQHTFERIQFQKATANNGKRRAQQQYYNLVVELYAVVVGKNEESQFVRIATRQSESMVVRGRSPGHYKDGRRDSSTSMGDSGGGHGSGSGGGDAGHSLLQQQSMRQQSYTQMPFMSYESRRGESHYNSSAVTAGGGLHHHNRQLRVDSVDDHSTEDISPLMSSSSSSPFEFLFSEPMEGNESADGLSHDSSQYQDDITNSSLRKKSSTSTTSKQSNHHHHSQNNNNHNNICLDLSSHNSGENPHEDTATRSFVEDTFDPMIPSYHSEQEDGPQQYLKHATVDRCQLAPIVHDSTQVGRSGAGSYSRFDPVQNSLCT